jgi:hypothetical protein
MSTKHNWFTTNLEKRQEDKSIKFDISISPYKCEIDTFYNNAKRVALEMSNSFSSLYLSYSGGLDSEFVLNTFVENDLKITPIIVSTPYNKREYEYALHFCYEKKIKPVLLKYNEVDIIEQLYKRTIRRGLYSLQGGVPLIACDYANANNGNLITGCGEPFPSSGDVMSSDIIFNEWDFYLDSYDNTHMSGFFNYDISLFHSLINLNHNEDDVQSAKSKIYNLRLRPKMKWDISFGYIQARCHSITSDVLDKNNNYIEKNYSVVLNRDNFNRLIDE